MRIEVSQSHLSWYLQYQEVQQDPHGFSAPEHVQHPPQSQSADYLPSYSNKFTYKCLSFSVTTMKPNLERKRVTEMELTSSLLTETKSRTRFPTVNNLALKAAKVSPTTVSLSVERFLIISIRLICSVASAPDYITKETRNKLHSH